ncbi:MAG: hypothetical protein WA125_17620 [Desulfosporosinus sp.]
MLLDLYSLLLGGAIGTVVGAMAGAIALAIILVLFIGGREPTPTMDEQEEKKERVDEKIA